MRFKGLDLNLLVAFDILIEERSVSKAAERLYISQPAMSAALRRLRAYFNDPILGDFQIPGNPLRFSEQTDDLVLVAPLLGQHNAEVMRELGYTDAEIDALGKDGTLVSSDR